MVARDPSKVSVRVRISLPAFTLNPRAYSSTAERAAHNRSVLGSNPSGPISPAYAEQHNDDFIGSKVTNESFFVAYFHSIDFLLVIELLG